MKIKTNNILEIYNTFYDENLKKKKKLIKKTKIKKKKKEKKKKEKKKKKRKSSFLLCKSFMYLNLVVNYIFSIA